MAGQMAKHSWFFAKTTRCYLPGLLGSTTPCSTKRPSPQSNSTFSSVMTKTQWEQRNNCIGGFIDLDIITSLHKLCCPFHPEFQRKQTHYQQHCKPHWSTTGQQIIPNPLALEENCYSSPRIKYSHKLIFSTKS